MAPATTKLASGHEMPLVGFGLWKVPAAQAAETVYNVREGEYSPGKLFLDLNADQLPVGHQGWIPPLRRCLRYVPVS
ncbi:NAD(P)H-dependent D-xylose reductase xyl1 [Ilyonectria robusta]